MDMRLIVKSFLLGLASLSVAASGQGMTSNMKVGVLYLSLPNSTRSASGERSYVPSGEILRAGTDEVPLVALSPKARNEISSALKRKSSEAGDVGSSFPEFSAKLAPLLRSYPCSGGRLRVFLGLKDNPAPHNQHYPRGVDEVRIVCADSNPSPEACSAKVDEKHPDGFFHEGHILKVFEDCRIAMETPKPSADSQQKPVQNKSERLGNHKHWADEKTP